MIGAESDSGGVVAQDDTHIEREPVDWFLPQVRPRVAHVQRALAEDETFARL